MTEELNTKDILILTCVFSPEPVVSSRMALDLAKELSIPINKLNVRQFNDFFLWSKYLINNNINLDQKINT